MCSIRFSGKFFIKLAIAIMLVIPAGSHASTARMYTSLGVIEIALFDTAAPLTVANFLNYVNSGAYNNSFIHRSVPGFIIQGGGYTWNSALNTANPIPANPPIANEFSYSRSNLRGTIAMAKLGSDPNSAASQWFINLADNSASLDNVNGGYTVFGQVSASSMAVIDAIAALPTSYVNGSITSLPLATPKTTASLKETNLVMVSFASIASIGTVVEFYNTTLDHYFITSDPNEAAAIDGGSAGPGWSRTGNAFYSGGNASVCRFYGSMSPGPNSHFYTADTGECDFLKQLQATTPATEQRWNYESLDFLTAAPTNGACTVGTTPVYRAYNNGFARGVDSNHRITSSQTAIQEVVARGWSNEGVVMCAPQ